MKSWPGVRYRPHEHGFGFSFCLYGTQDGSGDSSPASDVSPPDRFVLDNRRRQDHEVQKTMTANTKAFETELQARHQERTRRSAELQIDADFVPATAL